MEHLIYIGAWDDVKILNNPHFDNLNIIFVDSQPVSEYDLKYKKCFYRHLFIDDLKLEYKKIGYNLVSECELKTIKKLEPKPLCQKIPYFSPYKLSFYNKDKLHVSEYYISSAFPTRLTNHLKNKLKISNKLYISGYHPPIDIIDHMQLPLDLYCNYRTCYNKSCSDYKTIIDLLYDKDWKDYIKNIIFISHKNEFIICKDVLDLCNYCKLSNLCLDK